MIRGDIYWVELDPAIGAEADKTRPAVIVSNDTANQATAVNEYGTITVVPITKNVDNIWATQVAIPASTSGLNYDSKAQAEQVRSVAIERLGGYVSSLPEDQLEELEEALRFHLRL